MKGRSKVLIAKRDKALLKRYYFWTEIRRMRFDDALKILSEEEFFISEERIMAIIRENCNELENMRVRPVPKVRMPRAKRNTDKML